MGIFVFIYICKLTWEYGKQLTALQCCEILNFIGFHWKEATWLVFELVRNDIDLLANKCMTTTRLMSFIFFSYYFKKRIMLHNRRNFDHIKRIIRWSPILNQLGNAKPFFSQHYERLELKFLWFHTFALKITIMTIYCQ